MTGANLDIAVAIPACNEEALLPRCLHAIQKQTGLAGLRVGVVVLANNCHDQTGAIARRWAHAGPFPVHCREVSLPDHKANAGWARRMALEEAAFLVGWRGVLVSTDADCFADTDWLSGHLAALHTGVEAVAGRVSGDWDELQHFPADALRTGELEWRWQKAAAQVESLLDPVAHDPWPRHRQRSGANFSVCKEAWRRAGGVPPLAVGEDRAFLRAIEMAGGVVRHAPEPHVTTSARTSGRADGGMSTALARRLGGEACVDSDIETADSLIRRSIARAGLRTAFARGQVRPYLASKGLAVAPLSGDSIATLWQRVEANSPHLWPQAPLPGELAAEVEKLEREAARLLRDRQIGAGHG